MEEQAPAKRSVAELAGKFKSAAAAADEPGPEPKPVRRRPPRTLQIPIDAPAEQEKADGATSPLAAPRPKRNSALIEKLQANLALSPCALMAPKSPGFKFAAPSFVPPSPSSPSVTAVTPGTPTSPLPLLSPQSEEEVPASFETPATAQDGAVLVSINKSRARLSIKRRPPSRRHRTSSSGEEAGVSPSTEDTPLLDAPSKPGEEKPMGEGEGEGEGEGAGATLQSQEAVEPEAASGGGHGPPSAMDHEEPAVTHLGPPPDPQAPNSTETDGGGDGGGGGGGSEERGTQSRGQPEGKPDECLAMGEEEEGASESQDRPVGDGVSSADVEDEEESRDHKAAEGPGDLIGGDDSGGDDLSRRQPMQIDQY